MAGSPGVWVGVDVGSVRVGVAVADPAGILATPLRTLAVTTDDALVADLGAVLDEVSAVGAVVGMPRQLSGAEGSAAERARLVAGALAQARPGCVVFLVDERLTTVDAHRRLRDSGVAGRRQRAVVDQAAAVLILQSALDHLAAQGTPGGEQIFPPGGQRTRRTKGRR